MPTPAVRKPLNVKDARRVPTDAELGASQGAAWEKAGNDRNWMKTTPFVSLFILIVFLALITIILLLTAPNDSPLRIGLDAAFAAPVNATG